MRSPALSRKPCNSVCALHRTISELTVLDKKLISILDVRGQIPCEHGIKRLGNLSHHWSDEVGRRSCANTGLVVDELSLPVIFLEASKELDDVRVL